MNGMESGREEIFLSFIVSTYNREMLVRRTLASVHEFRRWTGCRSECVLIDDASTDRTVDAVMKEWSTELAKGDFQLIRNPANLGATGTKNIGAAKARGRWLLFVDADDLLIPTAACALVETLERRDAHPIVFFRCRVLETGELMGPSITGGYPLSLPSFLNHGTPGECLPAIRAPSFRRFPYAAALRGGEGLAYAGMMEALGPAWVSPLVVRRYRTRNADRLSGRAGLRRRACTLVQYHCIFLKRFHVHLNLGVKALVLLKMIYYGGLCGVSKLSHGR